MGLLYITYDEQLRADEMVGTFSTHRVNEKTHSKFFSVNLHGRRKLRSLGT
jgi:hypothetical protein